jgi:hypothetical protein
MSLRHSRHFVWGFAALTYGAFAVALHWHLVQGLANDVYAQQIPGSDSLLHIWTLAWGQHGLATDPLHVLDANIFHPYPLTLLYSDHLLALAVLAAPLRLFTDNVVLVHNVVVVAAPVLSALAMFALGRDLTRSNAGAFIGGLVYGFAPLRMLFDRTQVQMLAAWWLPLILLYARRTLVRARAADAVRAGVVLAAQGTSGIYLTAFFAPFLGLAHLVWLRTHPLGSHARGWRRLLAAEAGAALALLPFALAYRRLQASLGTVRSPVLNALLSLSNSVDPFKNYVPLVTLALLLVAALVLRRRLPLAFRREAWLFVAIAFGALVLAFGPALPLPFGWGSFWGPYSLFVSLPGFTALRAPGRMLHVALVGAAALAGGGVAALVAGRSRRVRAALVLAITTLAVVECWTPPFPTRLVRKLVIIDPVHGWLAKNPYPMRIVEIPLDEFGLAASNYQYASTLHWKKTLVGNMGILPPAYPYMVPRLQRFPAKDVLADLRALDVTHAVVHRPDTRAPSPALAAAQAGPAPLLKRRWSHGPTAVYSIRRALRPVPRVPGDCVADRTAWRATASQDPEGAARAIDDDPTSAWSSWGQLETGLRGLWWDPVPFRTRWDTFLQAQPTTLTVDLGTSRDASAVVLRLAGTESLAIPYVAVEGSLDGTTWTPFGAGLEAIPDVRNLVDHATDLRMGAFPPAATPIRWIRVAGTGFEYRITDLRVCGPAPSQ